MTYMFNKQIIEGVSSLKGVRGMFRLVYQLPNHFHELSHTIY